MAPNAAMGASATAAAPDSTAMPPIVSNGATMTDPVIVPTLVLYLTRPVPWVAESTQALKASANSACLAVSGGWVSGKNGLGSTDAQAARLSRQSDEVSALN